jgi:hypothetical protein
MATEVLLFFDIGPFGATALLVFKDTLTKLIVPDMGGCHIDRVRREGESKAFCVLAFTRALTTSDEDNMFHI